MLGVTPTIMPGDTVHHIGIAGFADAGDETVFDADIGFEDAGGINDEGVGDDAIERVFLRDAGSLAHPSRMTLPPPNLHRPAVAKSFSEHERSVLETNFVARGQAEHVGVMRTIHPVRHTSALAVLKVLFVHAGHGRGFVDRRRGRRRDCCRREYASAADRDELDGFRFAGLEADGGAGGNVEAFAVALWRGRSGAARCLDEMVMAADLDGRSPRLVTSTERFRDRVQNDFAGEDIGRAGFQFGVANEYI